MKTSWIWLSLLGLADCAPTIKTAAVSMPDGIVIPTRYAADRFFALAMTPRSDTVAFFLDTADRSVVWESFAPALGMSVEDSFTTRAGVQHVTSLPPSAGIPDVTLSQPPSNRIVLSPPADDFERRISMHASGQLGQQWFRDRIWTIDYIHHKLVLHQKPRNVDSGHRVWFSFLTDTTGRPFGRVPRIPIVIEGDTLLMLFDLGATMWLSDSAQQIVHDGESSERAWSLVRSDLFDSWRQRHPDWKFVEKGNTFDHSDIILVPEVSVGGFTVGPAWFGRLRAPKVPPPMRLRIDGTVGGSVLKYFSVYLDYPNMVTEFSR